ncbi:MAG: GGDEF domain-containing phosphodiesterase [Candidatus Thiodiazotropha sp.]
MTLAEPFKLRDEHIFVSASIGITVYPDDALSAEELLKNADQAMFAAKQNGRNRLNYFTKSMQEAAQQRMRLICDIHHALVEEQFCVYFQPIVSLVGGCIHKAEALLRWNHPEQGFISPATFIPVAEETGAIHEIGNWVFKQAVEQVKAWQAKFDRSFQVSINKSPVQFWVFKQAVEQVKAWQAKFDRSFQVSINKSPVQFLVDGMVQGNWLEHLAQIGMSPRSVVIEITEGVLLKAAANIYEKLQLLRDAGMEVAIDDFGTGYSSLAYLKRFDIEYLKLDKSFVSNLETDASNLALSEAIIVMAHKLGIRVIAEGVETEAQRIILRKIGCDYAQGFLFAKPMPAGEFELFLQDESSRIHLA